MGLTLWATRPAATPDDDGEPAPPAPAADDAPPMDRRRLALQLVLAAAVAVLAVIRFWEIPVWAPAIRAVYRLADALPIPRPNYLVNPLLFAVIPIAAVLALGARWRELGFRRGRRSGWVMAVWTLPVLAIWIRLLATGQATVGAIAGALMANLFQNGFGEEVLWRGIIQTRVARLWTPAWGLVLASLGFGLWHIDSIADWAGTDLWLAASLNLVIQAPMGLALGVIFLRTRSLAAPTVVHTVANSVTV